MMNHYPDLASASDWMKQINLTNQKQYPDLGSDASSVLESLRQHFTETSSGIAKCWLFSRATFDTVCHLPFQWLLLDLQIFFIIHYEIAGDPCNLIGSQHCDLFPNHTIFCSKSPLF